MWKLFAGTAWSNQVKLFNPASESDLFAFCRTESYLEKVKLKCILLSCGEVNGLNITLWTRLTFYVEIFSGGGSKPNRTVTGEKRVFEKMDTFICVAHGLLFLGSRMHRLFLYFSGVHYFSYVKFWSAVWKSLIFVFTFKILNAFLHFETAFTGDLPNKFVSSALRLETSFFLFFSFVLYFYTTDKLILIYLTF